MTWREEMVARILLLVARMLCEDAAVAQEIKHLSNRVSTAQYDRRNREEVAA